MLLPPFPGPIKAIRGQNGALLAAKAAVVVNAATLYTHTQVMGFFAANAIQYLEGEKESPFWQEERVRIVTALTHRDSSRLDEVTASVRYIPLCCVIIKGFAFSSSSCFSVPGESVPCLRHNAVRPFPNKKCLKQSSSPTLSLSLSLSLSTKLVNGERERQSTKGRQYYGKGGGRKEGKRTALSSTHFLK